MEKLRGQQWLCLKRYAVLWVWNSQIGWKMEKMCSQQWGFASKDKQFCGFGIHKLPERWKECIASTGFASEGIQFYGFRIHKLPEWWKKCVASNAFEYFEWNVFYFPFRNYIQTYMHNWSLKVWIGCNLSSHSTYVMCINLIHEWW